MCTTFTQEECTLMSKFQGKLSRAVLLEDLSYLVSIGESVHNHLFDKRLPRGALHILSPTTPMPIHLQSIHICLKGMCFFLSF